MSSFWRGNWFIHIGTGWRSAGLFDRVQRSLYPSKFLTPHERERYLTLLQGDTASAWVAIQKFLKTMKNHKKSFKDSKISVLLRKTFERSKMISVRNSKEFLTFLGTLSWRVVILATMCTLKRSRNRVKMIHNFGRYLILLNKSKGPDFVIAYLKASQLSLSKLLAGEPVGSLMELNKDYIFPRLANGIPKIIGPRDRISLHKGDKGVVILWMSIFGIFRVLAGTYKLKISTITDPFSGCSMFLAEKSITMPRLTRDSLRSLKAWHQKHREDGTVALKAIGLRLFQTSSPSSTVSWKGCLVDVKALSNAGLDRPLLEWMELTGSVLRDHFLVLRDELWKRFPTEALPYDNNIAYVRTSDVAGVFPIPKCLVNKKHTVHFITPSPITRAEKSTQVPYPIYPTLFKNESGIDQIGQVQFVKEPAGKLRTFAMVDVWTQSIMHPVHKLLTSILKEIPNDGTLNQSRSYERARQKSIQHGMSFGYDLSAATDRLPISIQVSILRGVFQAIGINTNDSVKLSLLWKEILVSRPFLVPKLPSGVEDPQELAGSQVYYEVGQPMGALSSFNSLALCHHMIMQDIASSFGMRGWCELYEITGDDIVIFDARLASAYLEYMKSLGLEINQKKSVVSLRKAAGEYLKKTWIRNIDVSMISWKQLYQNHHTLMGRVSDALYFLQKWSTHPNVPILKLIRKASLTYEKISSPDRDLLNVPILTLLSIAIRSTKVPLDIFLVFLFDEKKPNLSFRKLFGRVSDLCVDRRLAIKLITDFLRLGRIKPVETRSFLTRYQALAAGPLHGVTATLIDKILTIQSRLIIGRKLPLTVCPLGKEWVGTMEGKAFYRYLPWCESWYRDQFGLDFSLANSINGSQHLQYGSTLMLRHFVDRCVVQPTWAEHSRKMKKFFPNFELYVTKSDLQRLRGSELIHVLDIFVNLEGFLIIHETIDMDRQISHKANLSLLQSFKLGKSVSPFEDFITMWGREGEMYGAFMPDISQWMVKW